MALSGALAGCLVAVAGCQWLLFHDEDGLEICDDAYSDCLIDAVSKDDQDWCVAEVQSCYSQCEAGWNGESVADEADDRAEQGDSSDQGGSSSTTGDGDGDSSTTTSTSDTGDEPDACIELHTTCIAQAETLADVEACEALFEQCTNPGECSMCGCPADELEACLTCYANCSAAASTEAEVDACATLFDECVEPFAALCQVSENPNLDECLEQHALCVACADGDAQLAACQDVFDSCMIQL